MFRVALILALFPLPALAQQFNPSGLWYRTVNTRSNFAAGNHGLEIEMLVDAGGQLQAWGNVFLPQVSNPVQPVQGWGDWSVLPPEGGQGPLFKYRLHTQTHGILTWFVRPTGPGTMYNLFQGSDPQTGAVTAVETQCSRTG